MVIENGELTLKSGQQWISNSFTAEPESIALLDIKSNQRVYHGIYSVRNYKMLTSNGTKMVDFTFGSDAKRIYKPYILGDGGEFLLVLKLSIFNQIANLKINLEVIWPRGI